MQIVGADQATDDDVSYPPTMFARESLEWQTFEETGIRHDELPQPLTWHVLIFPKQPKQMSAGGIALPTQAQDVEMHLNYIGQVVAMGPLAGKNEKFENPDWADPRHPNGFRSTDGSRTVPFPAADVPRYLWNVKVGDWVIYGRYSGMLKSFKGHRFLTINDDDITDVIKSPEGFKVYV